MVILELYQSNYSKDLVVFDSLEEGRSFVSKIHGYTLEKEDQLEYEYFNPKEIPDYTELIYNGNIVPFSLILEKMLRLFGKKFRIYPLQTTK